MAFRLLRICDTEDLFEMRLNELKNEFLIPRNFKSKLIDLQFAKVRSLPGNTFNEKRNLALVKKVKVRNTDRVIAPFDYNPVLPNIANILAKHHKTMLIDNPDQRKFFQTLPWPALDKAQT